MTRLYLANINMLFCSLQVVGSTHSFTSLVLASFALLVQLSNIDGTKSSHMCKLLNCETIGQPCMWSSPQSALEYRTHYNSRTILTYFSSPGMIPLLKLYITRKTPSMDDHFIPGVNPSDIDLF
jgi:hypothetical protein